ncbi:MAG: hypothetical protein GXZ14_04845 [Ruminococcaceae bacterium]|nr:hypothetical protein [Oscillospiraceae bacterium]
MAANVTLAPALRDALLAAGAGALTAVLYRLLRLFTGGGKVACTVCDILVFAFAAFLIKAPCTALSPTRQCAYLRLFQCFADTSRRKKPYLCRYFGSKIAFIV